MGWIIHFVTTLFLWLTVWTILQALLQIQFGVRLGALPAILVAVFAWWCGDLARKRYKRFRGIPEAEDRGYTKRFRQSVQKVLRQEYGSVGAENARQILELAENYAERWQEPDEYVPPGAAARHALKDIFNHHPELFSDGSR